MHKLYSCSSIKLYITYMRLWTLTNLINQKRTCSLYFKKGLSKQHKVSDGGDRPPRVTDEGPVSLFRGQACRQVVISAVTLHESECGVFLLR